MGLAPKHFREQAEPLAPQNLWPLRKPSCVSTRMRDACDQTARNRIPNQMKHDRNVLSGELQRLGLAVARCCNHVRTKSNKFFCQTRQAGRVAVGPSCIDF